MAKYRGLPDNRVGKQETEFIRDSRIKDGEIAYCDWELTTSKGVIVFKAPYCDKEHEFSLRSHLMKHGIISKRDDLDSRKWKIELEYIKSLGFSNIK